jgi:phage/plasmid-like protein (TIGR03299 family)
MAHEVETMAYAGEVPWHGLGVKVDDTLTPQEMMKAAGLDWTVSKRPGYTLSEPDWSDSVEVIQTPDTYFVVRDSDNTVLSHCGNSYIPVQNERIFEFFERFTKAGNMTMETAGSLKNGSEIWGLAKVSYDFDLLGVDHIKGYLLINQPHKVGKSLSIRCTPIRVVCNNTLTLALQSGNAFRMPHVRDFNIDVMQEAEEALGLTIATMKDFQEKAEFLAKSKATKAQVQEFVSRVYQPNIYDELMAFRKAKEEGKAVGEEPLIIEQLGRSANTVLEAVERQPGAELKSSAGTWWGAFNAVTYFEDHKEGEHELGNTLHSAWFGAGANRKAKALDLALQYANAA